MKATQCNVLINRWSAMCTCEIDVAMSFLMLVSETMMAIEEEEEDLRTILLNC